MAISKSSKVIRMTVPKQHSHRLGTKMETELGKLAKSKRMRIDTTQTPSLTAAIDSASEWNSLLMTARAERGPQWDIGTQQFHVDKGSALYFDCTEIRKLLKPEEEAPEDSPQKPQPPQMPQAGPSSHSRNSPMTTRARIERDHSMPAQHMGHPGQGMPNPMHSPRRHTPGPPMNYAYGHGGAPVRGPTGGPPFPQSNPGYPGSPAHPSSPGPYYDSMRMAMGNPMGGGMSPGSPQHHPGAPGMGHPGMVGMPGGQPQHVSGGGMPMAGMPRPVGQAVSGMGGMGMAMPLGMGNPGGDMGMGGMMGAPGMIPGGGYPGMR